MNKFPKEELEKLSQGADDDELLDLFILAYLDGIDAANEMLSASVEADLESMRKTIEREVGGKTFRDRARDHRSNGTSLATLAETEAIRVYNQGVLDGAAKAGAKEKTWHTEGDQNTRGSHSALDGITIPLDAYFYTGTSKALHPGDFDEADENCGCRCFITVH